jgi:hypothetical protein
MALLNGLLKGVQVKRVIIALLAGGSLITSGVFAEEPATETNTSTVKSSTVAPRAEKKDIDEEITNAKLRASTGAKKTISMSSSFSYAGASLKTPFSTERPQLNDGQASADPAKLTAQMGIKFRATDHDNISVGFGLDFTPSYTKDRATGAKEPARTNASSPYVSYARVFKAGEVQNVLDLTLSKYTAKEDTEETNLDYSAGLSHTMMAPIGTSKFEIGLYSFFYQEIYSKLDPGQAEQTALYQFGINPVLEYAITDKASFRTVSRWLTWTTLNSDKERATVGRQTQSMGIGYALTRDIYLYPNMQWRWSSITADQTTVGFSANINL